MRIGIAGTGRMGSAIAQRLIDCGHTVTVWNRSQEKTEVLRTAGARVAATPTELASGCETVISTGATMKLAVNLPLIVFWEAFGEAMALARPLGLDATGLVELFTDTGGGTNVLKNRRIFRLVGRHR